MDLHCLNAVVQGYFTAALASTTHKTYKVAENHYVAFCEVLELTLFQYQKALYATM